MILDGQSVLITGGTGSFGHAFVYEALKHDVKKLIVLSRDELKQWEMRNEIPDPRLQFFIGDVRDRNRLFRAFDGVDYVIHAAALKQIPACEYQPFEAIQTNILGAANVIDAAIDRGVKKIIGLSTDKETAPINLYGATKLCASRLFVSGNSYAGGKSTRFAITRYGNVMGSRGSVIPLFKDCASKRKTIPITDIRMTRFWLVLTGAVSLVLTALRDMQGGETFVPKIPSMKIVDLAEAIAPSSPVEITSIRPGEKIHECLISEEESRLTFEYSDHYVIQPSYHSWRSGDYKNGGVPVPEGFSYTSDKNTQWLSIEDMRRILNISMKQERSVYV